MTWKNVLGYHSNHWITDFVVNLRKYSSISEKLISNKSTLDLVETQRYPTLELVNIYKVFKDKRNRLHYFTLSQPETIDLFLEVRNLWKSELYLECIDRPYYRVRKIYLDQGYDMAKHEWLYCLPQVNLETSNRQKA